MISYQNNNFLLRMNDLTLDKSCFYLIRGENDNLNVAW